MRPRWERFGLVVGLLIALAIMWGVLAIALVAGDEGKSNNNPSVIYEKPDPNAAPADEDR
jgi:hypothetical protein